MIPHVTMDKNGMKIFGRKNRNVAGKIAPTGNAQPHDECAAASGKRKDAISESHLFAPDEKDHRDLNPVKLTPILSQFIT